MKVNICCQKGYFSLCVCFRLLNTLAILSNFFLVPVTKLDIAIIIMIVHIIYISTGRRFLVGQIVDYSIQNCCFQKLLCQTDLIQYHVGQHDRLECTVISSRTFVIYYSEQI